MIFIYFISMFFANFFLISNSARLTLIHAALTHPVNIQGVMCHREVHNTGSIVEHHLKTWIAKLGNRAATGANEMIVLFGFECFFKLCYVFSKLMFDNQLTIEQ
jgi:hypothetical protein